MKRSDDFFDEIDNDKRYSIDYDPTSDEAQIGTDPEPVFKQKSDPEKRPKREQPGKRESTGEGKPSEEWEPSGEWEPEGTRPSYRKPKEKMAEESESGLFVWQRRRVLRPEMMFFFVILGAVLCILGALLKNQPKKPTDRELLMREIMELGLLNIQETSSKKQAETDHVPDVSSEGGKEANPESGTETDPESETEADPESGTENDDAPVEIAQFFPDETLRQYVSEEFDTDHDGMLSFDERGKVETIEVENRDIRSLEGIELFWNLWKLTCYDNPLTELDLRKNQHLGRLDCHNCGLTELKVPASVAHLYCQGNALTELDVSENDHLCELYCECNRLQELDVSHNSGLEDLLCYGNELTSVNLKQVLCVVADPGVTVAGEDARFNLISALQINEENFPDEAFRNAIADYDHENDYLYETSTKDGYLIPAMITTLDVSGHSLKNMVGSEHFRNIRSLYCADNDLKELDLSLFPDLELLDCGGNEILELDISANPKLTEIRVDRKVKLIGVGTDRKLKEY